MRFASVVGGDVHAVAGAGGVRCFVDAGSLFCVFGCVGEVVESFGLVGFFVAEDSGALCGEFGGGFGNGGFAFALVADAFDCPGGIASGFDDFEHGCLCVGV
ncbi:hypothetical protein, partial [Agrococcus casei]|uniref:hypothetical protein n=1 Tax=Agrococcus casei TaxID=343512 RepID=UPI003F930878